MSGPMTEQLTAVQLAIFKAGMELVTRRMANTLLCTGRSGVINTARDFSCSLVTARDELLSVSEGFPIHMPMQAIVSQPSVTGVPGPPPAPRMTTLMKAAPSARGSKPETTPHEGGRLTRECLFYDSVELDELHCPLIVHARRLRRDSERAGLFRGARGAEIEPVDCAVEVGFPCDGVVNPAQGLRGGGPGALAEAYLRRSSGERGSLPGCRT